MGGSGGSRAAAGSLEPYVAGFAGWLTNRGFSQNRIDLRVSAFRHLGRWLESEGLSAEELTVSCERRYLEARRAAGYRTLAAPQSLRLPVAYLREVGVVPAPAPVVPDGPLERLIADYRRYLAGERGLAVETIGHYERAARVFLADRQATVDADDLGLARLTAGDVSAFLARECPKRTISGARDLVMRLRSLLRYLHVTGMVGVPLQWALPGVAHRRDRSVPRGLSPQAVARLLASCDPRRTVGRRDYAVLLLLCRLGLRAGEVAAIQLEDIDWRRGEFVVRGKGQRLDRLPLPVDIGEAIVSYLHDRPASRSRAVFLRAIAPYSQCTTHTVSGIVEHACVRAGLPVVGAHRLRHTAATELLRAGGSLPEVAQVLRHQSLESTASYAKVDRLALRRLARPWPEGGRS